MCIGLNKAIMSLLAVLVKPYQQLFLNGFDNSFPFFDILFIILMYWTINGSEQSMKLIKQLIN